MATTYTENPGNFYKIETFVKTEISAIKNTFFSAEKVFFYDACSFQRHSNLAEREQNILIDYFKERKIVIFITRCILMELGVALASFEISLTISPMGVSSGFINSTSSE